MKNVFEQKKGITLIALVITIIVLLILAGISISMLTGNNGILQKATEAKTNTDNEQIKERVRLAYTAALVDGNGELTETNLRIELTNEFGNNYDLSEDTTTNEWVILVDEIERLRAGKGNTAPVENNLEIGHYVNYIPIPKQTNYILYSSDTGYDMDQTVLPDNGLYWRILNINNNGMVDLIGFRRGDNIVEGISFKGAQGYNNGVYLLNDMCNKLYSNENLGAIARSINIEDIQEHITDKNLYKNQELNQLNAFGGISGNIKYGNTFNYSASRKYPIRLESDDGILGESLSGNNLITNITIKEVSDKTITQTLWVASESTMQESFTSNIYYDLFYPDQFKRYFLASRFVHCDQTRAYFGLRCIYEGAEWTNGVMMDGIGGMPTWDSYGSSNYSGNCLVVPIVTIPSDAIHKIEVS